MNYQFKYKKGLFWRSIEACGHKLNETLNRMDIYHKNGSITSICEWSKCDVKLGTDWVLSTRKQMEKESGQDIKLNVE